MDDHEAATKQEKYRLLESVVHSLDDGVFIYDITGKLLFANREAERITGYRLETLIKQSRFKTLESLYAYKDLEAIKAIIETGERYTNICHVEQEEGAVDLVLEIRALWDEHNQLDRYICLANKLCKTRKKYEKIHEIRYLDETTGLLNQKAFEEIIDNKLERHGRGFGIVVLDISKLNHVNTTYGLHVGNETIKQVGNRIRETIGEDELLAKLGVDIFAIFYDGLTTEKAISTRFEQVVNILEIPFKIENHDLYVQINAGMMLWSGEDCEAKQLINCAQLALDKAKTLNSRNQYTLYEAKMQEEVQKKTLLESDMHKAYNNHEFVVYYQPFIDLKSQKITGMEALLRRRKQSGELMLPGSFIELLEEMELIEQVGLYVVEEVCKQLRHWCDKGLEVVPVGINLSVRQFKNVHLAKAIHAITDKYGIAPENIVFEITETVAMTNMDNSNIIIKELRAYGFQIAVDDFGTGYSCFAYLKKFLFNHLKIDMSFIREIVNNPQDRAIVESIIAIAKALKLTTIAEGIETVEQLELVQSLGCDIGQGYYWDAPIEGMVLEQRYLTM